MNHVSGTKRALCLAALGMMLAMTACSSGPGVAPQPPTSDDNYNGNLPTGTANNLYHP